VRSSALVLFAVTANYMFSKYRLQALILKIPASANLVVKYRPGRCNTGHLTTLDSGNPADLSYILLAIVV